MFIEEEKVQIEHPEVMNHQEGEMQNEEQRAVMRDFARLTLAPSSSCIRLGPDSRNYELKGLHFNMLPSFHGLPSEDPLSFIRDFYSVVEQVPLPGLNEDQTRMRCFPYCLKDSQSMVDDIATRFIAYMGRHFP